MKKEIGSYDDVSLMIGYSRNFGYHGRRAHRGKFVQLCVEIALNAPVVGKDWLQSHWFKKTKKHSAYDLMDSTKLIKIPFVGMNYFTYSPVMHHEKFKKFLENLEVKEKRMEEPCRRD
ncbi:hypothetical protein VNO77_10041 [Canavalia gladiata]|uniref:Uncharacterized protein n=1 Tax=Canavalia gladiata TaxID=3824 RepID=A0AAN9M9X2_CANGL